MPSTGFGLLLFVVLLAPGITYLTRLESRLASGPRTTLRETSRIAGISLLFNTLALVAFGIFRAVEPDRTVDVGALVRDRTSYVHANYLELWWWGLGLVSFACLLAYEFALPHRVVRCIVPAGWHPTRWDAANRGAIAEDSAWSTAFNAHADREVFVTCELVDGTELRGFLGSSSAQPEENADRALTLVGPLEIRRAGGTKYTEFGSDLAVVAASSLKFFAVSYLPDGTQRALLDTSRVAP